MQTLNGGDTRENHRFFPNCTLNKMDYRQKMVVAPPQKFKNDDDDDEDLEALRLAALQSLRTKDALHNRKQPLTQVQKVVPQITQTSRVPYKNQRLPRRGYFHNRLQQRQNGNLYYQSPRNPNLIAIVPVDEHSALQQFQLPCPVKVEKTEPCVESYSTVSEISKFHRYKDNGSASEEEDAKDHKNTAAASKSEIPEKDRTEAEESAETESQAEAESPQKNDEDQDNVNDDDDDILLMADLEEEDSLERLMDEMEREMNVDKPSERREKKSSKKDSNKESAKTDEARSQDQKTSRTEESSNRKENNSTTVTSTIAKSERRSVSPHTTNRVAQKRRSLSPRSRPRKKSPRRSPRRSPVRQLKKSQRETMRYRSPRKSPPRYSPRSRSPKASPRPRSPRLSPRRSPNRSPMRRSPLRKLSPRGRSPKVSPHPRSPRPQRSRSPRISSRSKSPRPPRSPKISRSRSPRLAHSRSPRFSPLRVSSQPRSPRSKSPRISPRRASPRRSPPRAKSPGLSPRRGSPRARSPKASPRRTSPRLRSPRLSPRRSPWSSPRNSPRLSPRRRRSPKWSPKELPRKHGPQVTIADNSASPMYAKETSPSFKGKSPESNRVKSKQREENFEKTTAEVSKEAAEVISDPVLEARRKKFESTRPIDPINANKKIKLSKKENTGKKVENAEGKETSLANAKKVNKTTEEYDVQDTDLCLDTGYEIEELEETVENTSPVGIATVNSCVEVEPPKAEKERSSKKKKKRDKELYQVGKLKNELPLSERIGKDKKCKKRKDTSDGPSEDVETIFEDIAADGEGDLRAELSRRRAERLNRTVPIQSARLVQSAFKGVVNEVVKNNAKANQRHVIKSDEKSNQKEVRRVTVLHRSVSDLHDSEDESALDSKVPVRFRLGLNKQVQDTRESKASRKTSKRQGRKVKHKNNLPLTDSERIL